MERFTRGNLKVHSFHFTSLNSTRSAIASLRTLVGVGC
jgi:hypothetical protein